MGPFLKYMAEMGSSLWHDRKLRARCQVGLPRDIAKPRLTPVAGACRRVSAPVLCISVYICGLVRMTTKGSTDLSRPETRKNSKECQSKKLGLGWIIDHRSDHFTKATTGSTCHCQGRVLSPRLSSARPAASVSWSRSTVPDLSTRWQRVPPTGPVWTTRVVRNSWAGLWEPFPPAKFSVHSTGWGGSGCQACYGLTGIFSLMGYFSACPYQ